MKTPRAWLLFSALLIAGLLFRHFFYKLPIIEKSKVAFPVSENVTVTKIPNANSMTTQAVALSSTNLEPSVNDRLKTNTILQSMESQNRPIEFYGQVIDQDNNPVSGVKVRVKVRHWDVKLPAAWGADTKMIPMEKETDLGGRFEINNVTGDVFDFESIQKTGYVLSPRTPNGFGSSAGSLQNPVIFKMWKLGEPQRLIFHHLTRIGVPVDGQAVQFDLLNGEKVSSGGQLIMRLKRDPQIIQPRSRYDWSLELEIPNGGLVATNDEFMYQAPENGYQKIFKFDMPKDAENWTTAINQQFYIELENGKYFGSLIVRLSTIHDTPPLGINLDIVINPNGSNSLQP